jgi:hypothetical protein
MAETIFQDVVDFFSRPAAGASWNWGDYLQDQALPPQGRLALCLDLWVQKGWAGFKKLWEVLPSEVRLKLGTGIGDCFLFRPLVCLVGPETQGLPLRPPLAMEKQGRIIKVISGRTDDRKARYYFPIPHTALWSGEGDRLQELVFSTPEIQEALRPSLELASGTRSPRIRERIQRMLFFPLSPLEPAPPEAEPSPVSATDPESPAPSRARKKSKASKSQMKLF